MGKMFKKILCTLLVVVMCLTSAPLQGFVGLELPEFSEWFSGKASASPALAPTGQCGDNVYWNYNLESQELIISGQGAMYDYTYYPFYSRSPFVNYFITNLVVEDGVTSIGEAAFDRCHFRTATLADSVTSIGKYAFYKCSNLETINFGSGLTNIDVTAFIDCLNITKITVSENNKFYSNDEYGVLFDKNKTMLIKYPVGNTRTSYNIPNSVESIYPQAFEYGDKLVSVTIPDSVTEINTFVFNECRSLTSIIVDKNNIAYSSDDRGVLFDKNKTFLIKYPIGNANTSYIIPDSVTTIGPESFCFCKNLTSVSIPNSVTMIRGTAFQGCENMISIIIPDSVTTIDMGTFHGCTNLTSITIPNSVTTIGAYAFEDCINLTSVTIPDSVTTIDDRAFNSCASLTSVTIPDSVTTIGGWAFRDCDRLTSVTIGDSVTSIGDYTFADCDSLTSVTIPDSVTSIGNYAFSSCKSLTSVTIPDSVTSICDYAFDFCDSLISVTIPDSVTSIGEWAFAYCDSLTDVYYQGSEEQWKEISIGGSNKCLTNATIHFAEQTTTYKGVKGFIDSAYFEKDSKVYNHDLGRFCSLFTVIGYEYAHPEKIQKHLKDCGFNADLKYIVTNAGRDEVNHFITHKKIFVDGEEYDLLFAGFIGSHEQQWYSNFDPEIGSTHLGFINAKNYVLPKITDYMKNHGFSKDKTKILLTGHSRGAATCNLVAAQLIASEEYATKDNIYAYAFATPRISKADYIKEEKYNRIFNIINPEDFVTKLLPGAWGFKRFGPIRAYESVAVNTYVLPSKTNTKSAKYEEYYSRMLEYYNELSPNTPYMPYRDGEATVHDLVYDFRMQVEDLDDYYNKPMWTSPISKMTPYAFFQNVLCPIVAHDYLKAATVSLTNVAYILAHSSQNNLYRKIINFFLSSEAIYMITNGLEDFTGGFLKTAANPYFSGSHCAETYCAYMYALSKNELCVKREGYKGSVNCPVDVEIYDKETGELVGRIVDNVEDEEVASGKNSVVMTVDGDSKSFWLPSDGDYYIKLIGNDEGIMDYTMSEIDSDIGEIKRVNFFDVEITEGLTMTADVDAEDFVVEEHELNYENGETLKPTEILNEEDIETYSIDISVLGDGFASESRTAKSGDYVSLTATANEGWNFTGWYENDELASAENDLAFVVKSNRSLEARFEHIDHSFGEWYTITPATCENNGIKQRDCTICGTYSESQTIPATGHSFDGSECTNCDYDKADECSCNCHASGIKKFFFKLILFFQKLFKKNAVCACGVAHY
ncbi:MAG: leucine-rich repeat protein [Clostridia bacterium]|nr:leucine-rich repeat protein [Clostridia bacterium]